jgi:tetratricopeptide (TPR) repeat protein
MTVTASLLQTRQRLAQYYLGKLRAATAAFRLGYDNSAYGLSVFDREWAQIKQWQAWSAASAQQDKKAASLCAEYPQAGAEILLLRQPLQERIEWLAAGLKAAQLQTNRKHEAALLYHHGFAYLEQASFPTAEEYASEALSRARARRDKLYIGRSLNLLGEIKRAAGNLSAAQTCFEESLAVFQQLGNRQGIGQAYRGLGLLAWQRSDWARARDYHAQHLAIAAELGLEVDVCDALISLSLPTWMLGDQAAALTYIQQCVIRSRAIGYHRDLASSLHTLGQMEQARGRLTEARPYLEEAITICRTTGILWNLPSYLQSLGFLLYVLGDYVAALNHLEEGLTLARTQGSRLAIGNIVCDLTNVYRALGDLDRSRQSLRQGLLIARDVGISLMKVHMVMAAMGLWRELGKAEQAAEWLEPLSGAPGISGEEQADLQNQREGLERELGPERLSAAIERGKTLHLDHVITDLLAELGATE